MGDAPVAVRPEWPQLLQQVADAPSAEELAWAAHGGQKGIPPFGCAKFTANGQWFVAVRSADAPDKVQVWAWQTADDAPDESEPVQLAFVAVDDVPLILMSNPQKPAVLVFTQGEWDAFVAGVRAGEFDDPETFDREGVGAE